MTVYNSSEGWFENYLLGTKGKYEIQVGSIITWTNIPIGTTVVEILQNVYYRISQNGYAGGSGFFAADIGTTMTLTGGVKPRVKTGLSMYSGTGEIIATIVSGSGLT